jgi:hypothetical protein
MARVLALAQDYNASVIDTPSQLSGSNEKTAEGKIPPQDAIVEDAHPDDKIDRHPNVEQEKVPAEIDHPHVLPPSTPIFPSPQDQQAETSVADKMNLNLPYHNLVSTASRPRSKVLLVEDNVINMKVFSRPLAVQVSYYF